MQAMSGILVISKEHKDLMLAVLEAHLSDSQMQRYVRLIDFILI